MDSVLDFFANTFIIGFCLFCTYYGFLVLIALCTLYAFIRSGRSEDPEDSPRPSGGTALWILLGPLFIPFNILFAAMYCFAILLGMIFNGASSNVPDLVPFYAEFYNWDYLNCIDPTGINSTLPAEVLRVLEMHKLTTFLYKFEVFTVYFLTLLIAFAVLITRLEAIAVEIRD